MQYFMVNGETNYGYSTGLLMTTLAVDVSSLFLCQLTPGVQQKGHITGLSLLLLLLSLMFT